MAHLAGLYVFPDADPAVVAGAWVALRDGSGAGVNRELGALKLLLSPQSPDQPLVADEVDPRRCSWGYGGARDGSQLERSVPPWLRCDYDSVDQRAVLRSDRYGFALLYWRQLAGACAFSTSALQLAQLPPAAEPDPGALAELIAFDQLLGERTHARGVSALPIGHELVLEPRGASLKKCTAYADLPLDVQLRPASAVPALLQAWRRGLGDFLQQAAGRKLVVPLSGGLDSRLLAATVAEHGASLETFTFGARQSSGAQPPDVTIARSVAAALGAPWRFLELTDGWLGEHAARACELTDGHLDVLHSAGVSFASHFAGGMLRLDGLAGDIVLGGSALEPAAFSVGSFEARLERLWRMRSAIDGETWRQLLLPDAQRQLREHARDGLRQSLADVTSGLAADDPRWLDFWVLRNRIRRFTTNGALLWRPVAESAFPFFAPEFFERVMELHPRHRLNAQLQARFLHEGYPAMARIPWQKTGRPVAQPGWLGRIVHHLRARRLPAKAPFFDFDAAFRRSRQEQELFRERLLGRASQLSAFGLFDPVAVSSLFERTLAGKAQGMRYLSLLATLTLAREHWTSRGRERRV